LCRGDVSISGAQFGLKRPQCRHEIKNNRPVMHGPTNGQLENPVEIAVAPLGRGSREVNLRLTPDRVIQICADAGLLGASDPLLDEQHAAKLDKLLDQTKNVPGTTMNRSFIRGLVVLSMLPRDGSGVGVVRLAEMLGIAPSTVHRYLTTFVALGLARQGEQTREYSRSLSRA
jgi:IclR helix-turn-helix domain